jgi:hypothetical protein
MWMVLLWILFGGLAAFAAHQKNRDPAPWFVFGVFLPPVAIITVLVVSSLPDKEQT